MVALSHLTYFIFTLVQNLTGMFDQMSSFVVVMDLLYENKQFERVLETMEIVKDRQLNGIKYPMDCVTLALAALYELVRYFQEFCIYCNLLFLVA